LRDKKLVTVREFMYTLEEIDEDEKKQQRVANLK
jgi:hypothetical protein